MLNLSDIVTANNLLIAALQKYEPNKTFVFAGKTWSTQDLITAFTNENNAIAATTSAKATWLKSTAAAKADRATNDPLRSLLHQAMLVQYGSDAEVLAAFGYKPRKQGIQTPETKVIAAAKQRATRAARGTLGSVERKTIHGALTSAQEFTVSVTPTATPGAPSAPSATAAPSASANGTTTQK
jgi:hypothetical protein